MSNSTVGSRWPLRCSWTGIRLSLTRRIPEQTVLAEMRKILVEGGFLKNGKGR
jgi:hypothetical protein